MDKNEIFVFGSNLAGRHGAGAALFARQHYDAKYGQGQGLQGRSYAIPTKDHSLNSLPLFKINYFVDVFIKYVRIQELKHPEMRFYVTSIGCGLAGYTPNDIAPMFNKLLDFPNVKLPESFLEVLNNEEAK